ATRSSRTTRLPGACGWSSNRAWELCSSARYRLLPRLAIDKVCQRPRRFRAAEFMRVGPRKEPRHVKWMGKGCPVIRGVLAKHGAVHFLDCRRFRVVAVDPKRA